MRICNYVEPKISHPAINTPISARCKYLVPLTSAILLISLLNVFERRDTAQFAFTGIVAVVYLKQCTARYEYIG
jgi:hypothetical protein